MVAISIDILAVCLELIIYFFFFQHFFGEAKFSKAGMFGIYTILGIVSFCLSWFPVPDFVHIIGYLIVILLIALCYQGQLFVKLLIPFLFQAIGMMVELCYAMILEPMRLEGLAYGESGRNIYYFTGVVLSNLTILLLVRLLANAKDYLFIRKHDLDIPMYFLVLFLFPVSMLFVINQFELFVVQTGETGFAAVLPVLILTLITVVFFFLFDWMLQSIQNKQQMELLSSQLKQEQQYHTILLDKHQQFQMLRHDMRHSFSNIAGLIKNGYSEEALAYAEQQSGQLAATSVIETGHPLMDTILTVKEDQAQKAGASFQSYIAADFRLIQIPMNDIASICSNALSNAIEAVMKISDKEQRKIWCSVTQDAQYLYISVKNTTTENVTISDNMVTTTKEDKTVHGLGLQIIQRITEKYDGIYTVQSENRFFVIKILLPCAGERGV